MKKCQNERCGNKMNKIHVCCRNRGKSAAKNRHRANLMYCDDCADYLLIKCTLCGQLTDTERCASYCLNESKYECENLVVCHTCKHKNLNCMYCERELTSN